MEESINELNNNISLKNITRQFSFKIHILKLKDDFLKRFDIYQINGKLLGIELEVQLFCGNEPISQSQKYHWKGISTEPNALLGKNLNFNIKYRDLPVFSSIIFKFKIPLKLPEKNKTDGKIFEKKTIAWYNFKIFDHLKRLRTGI